MASDNLISVEGETAARHSALGAARAVPRLGDRSAEGRAPQNTSMPSLSSCHSGGASVIGWAFAVVVALLGLGVTASGDGVVTVRGALVREGKHSTDGAHLVVDCGLGVLTEVVCDPRGMFSLEIEKHALCRVVTCLIDDREFAVLPSVFRIYDNAEMTLRVQEKNRVHATILDFDRGSPVRELKFYRDAELATVGRRDLLPALPTEEGVVPESLEPGEYQLEADGAETVWGGVLSAPGFERQRVIVVPETMASVRIRMRRCGTLDATWSDMATAGMVDLFCIHVQSGRWHRQQLHAGSGAMSLDPLPAGKYRIVLCIRNADGEYRLLSERRIDLAAGERKKLELSVETKPNEARSGEVTLSVPADWGDADLRVQLRRRVSEQYTVAVEEGRVHVSGGTAKFRLGLTAAVGDTLSVEPMGYAEIMGASRWASDSQVAVPPPVRLAVALRGLPGGTADAQVRWRWLGETEAVATGWHDVTVDQERVVSIRVPEGKVALDATVGAARAYREVVVSSQAGHRALGVDLEMHEPRTMRLCFEYGGRLVPADGMRVLVRRSGAVDRVLEAWNSAVIPIEYSTEDTLQLLVDPPTGLTPMDAVLDVRGRPSESCVELQGR